MEARLLADQLSYNKAVLETNVAGLDQEDSLASVPGGSNLNWIVGHVVATRDRMLELLGHEPIWDAERAALYGRGSQAVTAATALPLTEILEAFAASQETLVAALGELDAENLGARSPMQFFKGEAETLGSALAAFLFHESYHVGQTGVLRRVAGKEGAIQ